MMVRAPAAMTRTRVSQVDISSYPQVKRKVLQRVVNCEELLATI